MPNVNSLHRRLDRLGADDGPSTAEALEQAHRAHEARQAAWTAAGHPGAPPHKHLRPLSAEAPRADRRIWRQIAEGLARVIYGKDPAGSPFATQQAAYALDDDARWPRSTATRSMPAGPSMTTSLTPLKGMAVQADRMGQRAAEAFDQREHRIVGRALPLVAFLSGDCRRASPSTDGTANTYSLAARIALARVPNCFAQPSHSSDIARHL
jgi:hypothetical protein